MTLQAVALLVAQTPAPEVRLEDALPTLLVLVVAGLAALVFWVWMLVDIFRVPSDDDMRRGSKLTWTIVTLVLGPPGALAYAVVGRPGPSVRRS